MLKRKEINKDNLNDVISLSKKLLKVFYIITIIGIILAGLFLLKTINFIQYVNEIVSVCSPLIIGFIISWLVKPLYKKLISKGLNKYLAVFIIVLLIVAFIVLFFWAFIPLLSSQINDFISSVPAIIDKVVPALTNTVDKINIKGIDVTSVINGLISALEEYLISFTTALPNGIINLLKSTFSAVGTLLLSLIITIYMLVDYDNIIASFYKLFPSKSRKDVVKLTEGIGTNARRVVNGTLLVAFLVFIFDSIGFSIVGLRGAILFGLLCGITDLIPYIGPYIGGAAAVIVGFIQNPLIGVGILVIAVLVQIFESYILQPVVMSKAMQLSPITIMIGLLLFGHFFGIVGMVLATPLMAIIKELYYFIKAKLSKKKIEFEE